MIVRIDQQVAVAAVTSQVDLPDAVRRNSRQTFHRGETVIHGVDVYVVNVQQNSAVSFLRDRGQKDPFRHRRDCISQVAGNILDKDAAPESVLNLADSESDVPYRFFGEGKWQKIVRKPSAACSPAKMIGHPCWIEATNQRIQFGQVVLSQRIGATNIQRHAMKNYWRELAGLLQYPQRPPASNHEVLRDHFEPVRTRCLVENARIVNGPKTYAVT